MRRFRGKNVGKKDRITKSSRGNAMCIVDEEKGLNWVERGEKSES